MSSSPETPGQDNLPFKEAYEEVARELHSANTWANMGVYGLFNSNVVRQVVRPNPDFLPGGRFFDQFSNLFPANQDPNDAELFDLGVDIGTSICEQYKSPRNLILGYVNAGLHTDLLRIGLVGESRDMDVETEASIYRYTGQVIAEALPIDDRAASTFKTLAESLALASRIDPQHGAIFTLAILKMTDLQRLYLTRKEFNDYVGKYYPEDMHITKEKMQTVDNGATLLTLKAMKHRKYGTKPAYIEASTGGSWVFYDGEEFQANLTAKSSNTAVAKIPPYAAVVMHVPVRDLSSIDVAIESLPIGEQGNITRTKKGVMVADPDFSVIIHFNGSMSIDSDGLSPLEAALVNKPSVARMLKAEIASNFYDLSMPIYTDKRPRPRNYAQMTEDERKQFDPITQLLIPRLRYLQTPSGEELSENTRIVRRHDVTWYVRPLPLGWHASPEAIANAAKLGLELGPNETFVKKHERGIGTKVLGYHAVHRTIDKVPGEDY